MQHIIEYVTNTKHLIPRQRAAGLVFRYPRFKEVLLFFQVDHFCHPREGVAGTLIQDIHADLLATAVGDKAQILFKHTGI